MPPTYPIARMLGHLPGVIVRARTMTAVLDAIDAGRRPVDVERMQRAVALMSRADLRTALLWLCMTYSEMAEGNEEMSTELAWLRQLVEAEGDRWLLVYAETPITEAI